MKELKSRMNDILGYDNESKVFEFAVIESAFGSFEFISDGDQWLIVSAG